MQEEITSRQSARVKFVTGLMQRRKDRDAAGCFVTEGLRLCLDAVSSGLAVRTLLVTREALARWPQLETVSQAAQETLLISPSVAEKLASTNSPQGVFAVCQKPDENRNAVTIHLHGRYLLLAHLQDPGNLGTILRTADALGIDGVYLTRDCPDLYSPKVLRSAMGGIFRLPFAAVESLEEPIAALQAKGIPVYAAALSPDAQPLDCLDFRRGSAALIGNEGNGLPEHLIQAASGTAIIPMADGANSLNAAVAAGIFLWEMYRQSTTRTD